MLTVDGSRGEGGGQILRTSLALSLVTRQPFRIRNIRAGRKKPGLMRQHLTAVQAAAAVGHAELSGAEIGSQDLRFSPGTVTPGDVHFSVGTAGSTTLVLQTILPALMTANEPSTIVLDGGTHNPFAPPFEFLAGCFAPLIARMGPRIDLVCRRPGFYPAGGGSLFVRLTPSARLTGFELPQRGDVISVKAQVLIANLPRHIAERESIVLDRALSLQPGATDIVELSDSAGPGNVVLVEARSAGVTELFSTVGTRGVPAEAVATQAAAEAKRYLTADVAVAEHLADQLVLPLALAGEGSFTTLRPTDHLQTNVEVIREFLSTEITLRELGRDRWSVELRSPK